MPIYEYRCEACGHDLEVIQRFSDAQLTTCPACGKETLKKQLSAAGFQLKGSGWYATDFKNSGSKPAAKNSPSTDAKPSTTGDADTKASSDTKSESTSESKSESKPATETKSVAADKPSGTTGSSTASS